MERENLRLADVVNNDTSGRVEGGRGAHAEPRGGGKRLAEKSATLGGAGTKSSVEGAKDTSGAVQVDGAVHKGGAVGGDETNTGDVGTRTVDTRHGSDGARGNSDTHDGAGDGSHSAIPDRG